MDTAVNDLAIATCDAIILTVECLNACIQCCKFTILYISDFVKKGGSVCRKNIR